MSYLHSSSSPIRPKERFLVFGQPSIGEDEIEEVVQSMRASWIGTGPKVKQFEEDFRGYINAPFTAALNSCTAALHLSMIAAGLKTGDEVITTAMTFCATVNAIIHTGATPILADIDPKTFDIDSADIEKRITPRTRAIVPVHFAGFPCEMDAIMDIAKRHNLLVIEDCAHAIEATYKGVHTGNFGVFGCFSFYATKNITTAEGGMVVAKRQEDIERIKVLGLHGMTKDAWRRFGDEGYKHYFVVEAGYKYNMSDLHASLGIHQLGRIERWWKRREEIWQRYNEAFASLPVTTPLDPPSYLRHAYHLYTLLIGDNAGITRDQCLEGMTKEGIGVGVHYLSIPEHPFYQERFHWKPEDYPQAMRVGRQTISIPLSAKLTDDDVRDVIAAVHKVLS